MEWKKLICTQRFGDTSSATDNRNSFVRDFDRIVFSKEFRLLQSKTQVVPFPELDMTHTRLTHSLETASVGRSLGIMAAQSLGLEDEGFRPEDIGAIVSAACLCHDIGNPPLGHSGEDAIAQFFKDDKGSKLLEKLLTKDQQFDFTHFEGNAIGFHLLTNSDPTKTRATGGLCLTYSTLAAFAKYPNRFTGEKGKDTLAILKKPGLLQIDLEKYQTIASTLGVEMLEESSSWVRHPLAYLTEASDDICYAVVDLEDGYRNKDISYDDAHDLLTAIITQTDECPTKTEKMIKDHGETIGYLRAKAVNSLIQLSVETFKKNAPEILAGTFKSTLVKSLPAGASKAYKDLKHMEETKIYTHRNILLTEAAGFVVLPGLLDIFTSAAFEDCDRSKKIRECLISDLICIDEHLTYEDQNYHTLLNIVKYVALMTDSYAVKLYRELTGIQLPNY